MSDGEVRDARRSLGAQLQTVAEPEAVAEIVAAREASAPFQVVFSMRSGELRALVRKKSAFTK